MSALVSFVLKMMIGAGKKVAANLDSLTCDPDAAQNALLLRLLAQSADTEIGRKYDFSSIENADDFRAKVPLSVYDDYAESIERMMAGEKNVLTTLDIVHFNETSGTLGAPKSIPVTEQHVGCFADINAKYLNYIAAKKFGKGWTRGKALSLSEGTYRILPSGISCGCASALHTARMSQKGKGGFDSAALMYTSPSEARQPVPGTPTRYLHARFALMEKNVTYGNATFSSFLMEIFRYIEAHWEALCDDIEKGTVSVEMPEGVMDTLSAKLVPMPERARELRAIFSQGFDEPFAPKVWPGLRFFTCVAGAGFQPYTDKLKNRYLGPDIDILYLGLTASEGLFSVPIEMNNPNAVFVPNACFLEFIPIVNEERDLSEGTKLLGELELGKRYELVVTNMSGLFRYQLKDVIEVTGFYNKTPLMQFVNRFGFAISMYAEKTTDEALRFAALKTCEELGLDLVDYCVCPYSDCVPGKYIFMYELHDAPTGLSIEMLRDATEKYLCEANSLYKVIITHNVCQPTEVRVLQPETFLLYRDLMVMKGRSAAQLKPVHVTSNPFQQRFFLGLTEK